MQSLRIIIPMMLLCLLGMGCSGEKSAGPEATPVLNVSDWTAKDDGAGMVISFTVPSADHVRLDIRNATDYMVRTLVDEFKDAGIYSVTWDGKNNDGDEVDDGIYLIEITAGGFYGLYVGIVEW